MRVDPFEFRGVEVAVLAGCAVLDRERQLLAYYDQFPIIGPGEALLTRIKSYVHACSSVLRSAAEMARQLARAQKLTH